MKKVIDLEEKHKLFTQNTPSIGQPHSSHSHRQYRYFSSQTHTRICKTPPGGSTNLRHRHSLFFK